MSDSEPNINASRKRSYYYAFFALAVCALIVPLYLVEVPPLVDLPNHLARIFILANYDQTPFFQRNFEVVREPIPNLAMDLIIVPLLSWFDIRTAARLFLTLTVVLFAVGCHLAGKRENEQPSFSAIAAMFLVYSGTFFYGFINYVFSIALFFIAFGLWLRWREKFYLTRVLTIAALTSAIFLAHLSAFVFFGLAVFIINFYELLFGAQEKRKWTFFAADCALFILPSIAFLSFMSGTGNVGILRWNTFYGKAVALFSSFRSYDLWLDLLCVATLAGLCFWLKRLGQIEFDKKILSLALVFLLIFLVSPSIFFTTDADLRIALPALALVILSCRINVLTRKTLTVFAVVICLFAFRQAVISHRWIQMSERMAAEKKLLQVIEPESKVYVLFVDDGGDPQEKFERPIRHVVHYLTIENASFAPTLFAIRGQQPLVFRQPPPFATLFNRDKMKWLESLDGYDYVWAFGVPQAVSDELDKRGKTVAERGKTKIWKLNK